MTEYELLWRNKFLCTGAKNFDEFIATLEGAVTELKSMRAEGIKLRDDGSVGDDYTYFITEDADLAKKYDMEEVHYEDNA